MFTIGDKIREFRIRKGFSQENIAEMLNMSLTGYAKIEQNKTPNISVARLEQIAEALDTNIFELMSLGEKSVAYVSNINGTDNIGIIQNQINNTLENENSFLKEKNIF
jgi:transcriptional regulator with XRE-family HTH domain